MGEWHALDVSGSLMGDGGAMSSPGLSLRSPVSTMASICRVEVPGVIEGKGFGVVAALGGFRRIAESFQAPRSVPLILRLSPADPYSKFVPAKTFKGAGLLLRVRKWRSGKAELRLEGVVNQTFQFTALADYCLAPPDDCRFPRDVINDLEHLRISLSSLIPSGQTGRQDADTVSGTGAPNLSPGTSDPLASFLAPPVFTRQFHPFPYKYRDNASAHTAPYFLIPEGGREGISRSLDVFNVESILEQMSDELKPSASVTPFRPIERGSSGVANVVARFDDAVLPDVSAVTLSIAKVQISRNLLQVVQNLFEQRPLWQRVSLMDNLPGKVTIWRLKPVLSQTCFLFLDGPWRGCICRYGFDPRREPESRKYQVIDFRDPFFRAAGWKTQSSDAKKDGQQQSVNLDNQLCTAVAAVPQKSVSGGNLYDWRFREPPTRPSHFYQLCDIDDTTIQQILRKAPLESTCSRASGWYSKDIMSRVRDSMVAKARIMRGLSSTAAAVARTAA